MTKPERWAQVEKLFQAALALEPEDRAAFLDQACKGDLALRREVESLISSHDRAGSFISSPAIEAAAPLLVDDEPDSLLQRPIGPYRVLSLIGEGGMGEVYLAEDTRLRRKVALKLLPKFFTQDQQRLNRFKQEAQAASALNHPNIITIHDIGEADGRHFIATEFVEGETLGQHLADSRMSLSESLDVAVQVASALSAAHQSGIVHRDIKPDNIMLRPDGIVKVLDFGLAKLTERRISNVGTQATTVVKVETDPGTVMGTASYMSPEQARGREVDVRSDIFSLGVVIYEMVAGRVPFKGETATDVIVSILEKEPVPLSHYSPEAPAELQWIVTKALSKQREDRYQTVREMLSDLREVREQVQTEARLERSQSPEATTALRVATGSGQALAQTADEPIVSTGEAAAARTTSSAEYLISEIKLHRRGALIGVAILVLVTAVAAYIYFYPDVKTISSLAAPTPKFKPLTNTGDAYEAVISPDGRFIAYRAAKNAILVDNLKTGSRVKVRDETDDSHSQVGIAFSPDGEYLYYGYGKTNEGGALYRIPKLGGQPQKVALGLWSRYTFSPDGKQIAYFRHYPKLHEYALIIANTDGSGERKLSVRKAPSYYQLWGFNLSWSPDGQRIACSASDGKKAELVEVNVADGTEKPIPLQENRWADFWNLAWTPDRKDLIFTVQEVKNSPDQIWRVSYPNGEVYRITNDTNAYGALSLSADGTTLVVTQSQATSNLFVLPEGDSNRARQIVSGSNRYDGRYGVAWTPDGKIVFMSNADGNQDLYMINADGSNLKQITFDREFENKHPSVTPDGRYIVFDSLREGRVNIWRIEIDGSQPMQLTDAENAKWPSVTPDGRTVI